MTSGDGQGVAHEAPSSQVTKWSLLAGRRPTPRGVLDASGCPFVDAGSMRTTAASTTTIDRLPWLGPGMSSGPPPEPLGARHWSAEWRHLERAHILNQPLAVPHVRTHAAMLSFGVRRRNRREVLGQLVRLVVAAPGSWTGRYPRGTPAVLTSAPWSRCRSRMTSALCSTGRMSVWSGGVVLDRSPRARTSSWIGGKTGLGAPCR